MIGSFRSLLPFACDFNSLNFENMLSSAENRMWLRYLAADRIRQYQQQLERQPHQPSFHLALHGSFFEEGAAQDVIASLGKCSQLESIFLDDFQCTSSTWMALEECLQVLAERVSRFQLRLRRIHVVQDGETGTGSESNQEDENLDESDVYLARRLSQRVRQWTMDEAKQSMVELHLIDCSITSHGAQVLFSNLGNTTTSLELLSLEGNSIGNAGIRYVAQAMEGPLSSLQTLSVERVGASDDGIRELLESIRHHRHLKSLNLTSNVMNPDNVRLLCDILSKENLTLECFQWDGHDVLIDFWLSVNRAGRRFVLQDHNEAVRNRWPLVVLWPWILERLAQADPSILYFFVRSRPEYSSRNQAVS